MAGPSTTIVVDPLFDDGGAAIVSLAQRGGPYRSYSSHEKLAHPVGEGLSQRHDAVLNFLRTGGRLGRTELPASSLVARTGYLREEYAYDGTVLDRGRGIEPFLHHESLAAAARSLHDCALVEPSIAYANLMLPGQELAVHTDVPEFRGLNRKLVPQWFLVVMHHSGLFDRWRLPIATAISWFSDGAGGELSLWPEGPDGPCILHPTKPNTALVLDTDSLFHGVDPVGGPHVAPPPLVGDSQLVRVEESDQWRLIDERTNETRASYAWDDLRLSVSWKAYCFPDEATRDAWHQHTDDLDVEQVLQALIDDLRSRGALGSSEPERDGRLGQLLIDTYIRFPASATH